MSRQPVRRSGSDVIVDVWVVPGSSQRGITGLHGDKVRIRVASPPEMGKATDEVAEILEHTLGSPVLLVRGMSSRHKVFKVSGLDPELVRRELGI